ncbi:hypothetical protein ApDm4_0703 [Acetobacter pomorum]|nr:hypothetical protein ApDm4_0703 [Acetobacter pomorum]
MWSKTRTRVFARWVGFSAFFRAVLLAGGLCGQGGSSG